jgi:predicted transcriptional regulator
MTDNAVTFTGADAIRAAKALASDARVAILELVGREPRTIGQLATALGLAQPAISNHVHLLAAAGLLTISAGSGERGATKICSRRYAEVHLRLTPLPTSEVGHCTTLAMPVGGFTRCDIHPTCGLATPESLVGYLDDPRAFYAPARTRAAILWFGWGFVEYEFPNPVLAGERVQGVELSAEICSEAPGFAVDYPSEISFSINDIPVGRWISPGDMADERGALNPAWWQLTQYGFLKMVSIRPQGAFIDGVRVSDITPDDLFTSKRPSITVRLAVQQHARYRGGLTLFGRAFGNYPQDLVLTVTT